MQYIECSFINIHHYNISWSYRDHTVDIPCTYRVHTVYISWKCTEHVVDPHLNYLDTHWNYTTRWGHSRHSVRVCHQKFPPYYLVWTSFFHNSLKKNLWKWNLLASKCCDRHENFTKKLNDESIIYIYMFTCWYRW